MKKARTRLFAMTLAIIIFSLCAFPASAQTVSESASQFLRTQAAVRLTAAKEAEVKEAVLNNEINESNQENVLKLAMKQYLERSGTMEATLSSDKVNDEWIISQECTSSDAFSSGTNSDNEKNLAATTFLVLNEKGEKVTPSVAAQGLIGTLEPGTSNDGLSQYFVYGSVTHYATVEYLDGWYPIIHKFRIDKIVTTATNARPSVGFISSFSHYVWAGNSFERKYFKDATVRSPVSDRGYTLMSNDMGFHIVQNSPQGDDVIVGALFYTTGADNFEIVVSMYDFYQQH